ncbi:hypothetical protein Tco_0650770 [Tanacetum coccineum]
MEEASSNNKENTYSFLHNTMISMGCLPLKKIVKVRYAWTCPRIYWSWRYVMEICGSPIVGKYPPKCRFKTDGTLTLIWAWSFGLTRQCIWKKWVTVNGLLQRVLRVHEKSSNLELRGD